MRRCAFGTVLSMLCLVATTASAQSLFPPLFRLTDDQVADLGAPIELCGCDSGGCTLEKGGCDTGCDSGCCDVDTYCCNPCRGRAFFRHELPFLRYHQSGGVQEVTGGVDDGAEFDFAYSPRFILGYENCNGVGYRINYWFFDEEEGSDDGGYVSIEAMTFDAEIYKRVNLNACTVVEGFGGWRYSDFEQRDGTGLDFGHDTWGGTVGLEVSHRLTCNQRIFARTRWSIMMSDVTLTDPGDLVDPAGRGYDHETTQVELAMGWEGTRCLCSGFWLVYGLGAEWHQWSDAAIVGDASDEAQLVDAGWGGFTFKVGVEY